MIQPPTDQEKTINGPRALVLLASTAVLVLALLGWIFTDHQAHHIPTDPGTPATVTTIGGPR